MVFGVETQSVSAATDQAGRNTSGNLEESDFQDAPVRCLCPTCKRTVVTYVEHSHNWGSICLIFGLFLCFSFIGLVIYPFIAKLFKDTLHSCPRCGNVIVKRKRIQWPRVSRDIVTVQCGNCAIVLSKTYLVVFGLTAFAICMMSGVRWYLRTIGLPDLEEGPLIEDSWESFGSSCGYRSSLGNPLRAMSVFQKSYYGNTVIWEGRLNRVEEGFFQRSFVFINMAPHQMPRSDQADIALMFNMRTVGPDVAELDVGDKFLFKATLLELGRRGSPHLGLLWSVLNVTAKASELPDMFEESASSFYMKPPIAHIPRLARKIADARKDFIEQRIKDSSANGNVPGFLVGDEFVGLPPHLIRNVLGELRNNTVAANNNILDDKLALPKDSLVPNNTNISDVVINPSAVTVGGGGGGL